jgi:hypothetical protein
MNNPQFFLSMKYYDALAMSAARGPEKRPEDEFTDWRFSFGSHSEEIWSKILPKMQV